MIKMHGRFIISTVLLFSHFSLIPQAILWDLGGVLFQPDKYALASHEIGLHTILWYTIRDLQNPTSIQQRAFDALYTLGKQSPDIGPIAYGPGGLELPQIMCNWLQGKETSQAILEKVSLLVDHLEKQQFFVSTREKNIIQKTLMSMFDPDILPAYMLPATYACPLLEKIMNHPSCKQYIISNWDSCSFASLYQSTHGQQIFRFFEPEHIIISGECGMMKPHRNIFEYAFSKYNLNPTDCLFIDDQLENIKTARACGMKTIWFHEMDFDELYAQIRKRGFLVDQ